MSARATRARAFGMCKLVAVQRTPAIKMHISSTGARGGVSSRRDATARDQQRRDVMGKAHAFKLTHTHTHTQGAWMDVYVCVFVCRA